MATITSPELSVIPFFKLTSWPANLFFPPRKYNLLALFKMSSKVGGLEERYSTKRLPPPHFFVEQAGTFHLFCHSDASVPELCVPYFLCRIRAINPERPLTVRFELWLASAWFD